MGATILHWPVKNGATLLRVAPSWEKQNLSYFQVQFATTILIYKIQGENPHFSNSHFVS